MSHIRLSLPKGISTSTIENDTFSRDLLRQFDKKRSRLHFELGFTSQEPSPESSIIMTPAISEYYDEEPVQLDDVESQPQQPNRNHNKRYIPSQNSNATSSKRSSSASELFRRSSAFLRSKFDLFRAGKPQEQQEDEEEEQEEVERDDDNRPSMDHQHHPRQQPKKLMMKTTISIPSTNTITARSSFSPLLSTPATITQYPPKPLVYSPIEPIPNTSSDEQNAKPLLHRISMPLLRVYNDTTTNLTRNKSITSFGRRRKSEPDNNTKKKLKRASKQPTQ